MKPKPPPPAQPPLFRTITSEDWKRSLASARKRRATVTARLAAQLPQPPAQPINHRT